MKHVFLKKKFKTDQSQRINDSLNFLFLQIRLHKRVIDSVQNYQRTQAQWKLTTDLAMYLEDCEQAEITGKLSYSLINNRTRIPENIQFLWHVIGKRRLAQVGTFSCSTRVTVNFREKVYNFRNVLAIIFF